MKKYLVILFVLTIFTQLISQQPKSIVDLKNSFSTHVYYLADDSLEGRGTGTAGEKLAQAYIITNFIKYGISPLGENGFLQAFDFTLGKKLDGKNSLSLKEKSFTLEKDFYPLVYSGNGSLESKIINVGFGIDAGELYNDYKDKTKLKGKIFVINMSSPDGIHPHSKYKDFSDYKTKIATAQKYGAAAIIFYNEDKHLENPAFELNRNVQSEKIPIVFIQKEFVSLLKNNERVKLEVSLSEDTRRGENVVGFIDNNAENTVVIGAHYDHLGWGKDGGSLYKGPAAIHNGADDNASGVSMLLELANYLKTLKNQNNNYLFICFSAEELGLIGSKSFLLNPTLETAEMNYMINLDMVGRLDSSDRKLAVGGIGTSPLFKTYTKSITQGNLDINTSESGMGPSDHASFYLKNIPVLFLFTGTHQDYHKPSDDAWKINYSGMTSIFEYTTTLISELDDKGKLEFVQTKEDTTTSSKRKFSVTLGVVPDYMYSGKGMKIDGVTEGKPGANAGMIAGDIVLKMGDIEVTDMMAYMNALGKFNKGDTTNIEILRNNQIISLNITF